MRKFFCATFTLSLILACFTLKSQASDDERDFEPSSGRVTLTSPQDDEIQTQEFLSSSGDEEDDEDTAALITSLDGERLLPPGLLNDSGTFTLQSALSVPEESAVTPSAAKVKYRYPLDPGRKSLRLKQNDFVFCEGDKLLGYAWFLNQKRVPLYRYAHYALSDGAETIYVQGSEVQKAGKRVRSNLNLLHVIDQLRHVWSYNGPLTPQPYTFLTQGNAFFPYFHVGRTFSKKTYAALRIGRTWYALRKNAQINFQYVTPNKRSQTQKVSARAFADLLKENSPVTCVITQVKKKRRGKFEVVYSAN